MERAAWLKQMQDKVKAIYDHVSPEYWEKFGGYPNEIHKKYLKKFLGRMTPGSILLSAACGAGRYDGILLEAGHRVVGIDQSVGMLERARERFPEVSYKVMRLQEMDFQEVFDGVVCIDAMEHVCPEDWPIILGRFREALKSSGLLYFSMASRDHWLEEVEAAYQRAKERGMPVVFGELVDEVEEAYEQAKALEPAEVPVDLFDVAAYHYCPSLEQVRTWIEQAGLAFEEEGVGSGYDHFLVSKR